MSINDLRRELRIGGLEGHIHQPAVGNSPHAEASEKSSEFWRTLLIRKIAGGNGLGGIVAAKRTVADGLERKRFAGQNLGLRLDAVLHVHHVVVRISSLKGQHAGILATQLDACTCYINRLHAKGSDGNDGDHREHEGKH